MIYYEGEKMEILYQVLHNEFKKKYNWDIEYTYDEEIVLKPHTESNVIFKIQNKTITVVMDKQNKTINNSYCNTILKNIYKYYFQFLITNFIRKRPTKIYSLFLLSFFQLNSSDRKYYPLY